LVWDVIVSPLSTLPRPSSIVILIDWKEALLISYVKEATSVEVVQAIHESVSTT
jgi:hypothetical protein